MIWIERALNRGLSRVLRKPIRMELLNRSADISFSQLERGHGTSGSRGRWRCSLGRRTRQAANLGTRSTL